MHRPSGRKGPRGKSDVSGGKGELERNGLPCDKQGKLKTSGCEKEKKHHERDKKSGEEKGATDAHNWGGNKGETGEGGRK